VCGWQVKLHDPLLHTAISERFGVAYYMTKYYTNSHYFTFTYIILQSIRNTSTVYLLTYLPLLLEVTKCNVTKLCQTFGSEPDLKMDIKI